MQAAIRHLCGIDPILASIIAKHGPYRLTQRSPTFETLARSITFQQLHGRAAKAIFERVKRATGGRLTASGFLELSEDDLRGCGLSRQKIASIRDLAERVQRKEIRFRKLPDLSDEQIIATLSQVRGVGVWTVQMFLMFALERPNVLPVTDLGIRSAIAKAYGLPGLPKPAEIDVISSRWHPYCTVACWYLWRSLDGAAEL
jgi:DNA-3-methyladenine glycosylase II